MKKMIFGLSLVLLTAYETQAQGGIFSKRNKATQYSTVGFGGGTSHYYGDLSPYSKFYIGTITTVRWNATANYTRQLTPNFGARVSFSWARIMGDDYSFWSKTKNSDLSYNQFLRNLHFRNDVKEFAFTGIFNLANTYNKGPQARARMMPYGFLGFGFYAHNPQARDEATIDPSTGAVVLGPWTTLKDKQTSGQGIDPAAPKSYSLIQPVFPVGLGIKFKINDKFDFSLEGGFRVTPFDYLDDVGDTMYPNPAALAPTLAGLERFSNRAGEDYTARTGKNRINEFVDIATNQLGAIATKPSDNGEGLFGYAANSSRGSKRWDTYVLTQFTISYVIDNKIKCPVIK